MDTAHAELDICLHTAVKVLASIHALSIIGEHLQAELQMDAIT